MKQTILRRATLGSAALLASLALYACQGSGSIETDTTIDPPFAPPIRIKISASTGGTKTLTAEGGPSIANKCVEVTYSDAEGMTTGTTTLQADANGAASGQVPPGSVRWSAVIVDCPEPEPEPGNGGGPDSGGGGWFGAPLEDLGGGTLQTQQTSAHRLPDREFLMQGGVIVPSAVGANLSYVFVVQARSFSEANALVEPILSIGPGAQVASRVEVLHFATTEATPDGLRFVAAQPGEFQSWGLGVNQGAFEADQDTAIHYQVGEWDVMETLIPNAALEGGGVSGVTYTNQGELSYATDRLGGVASGTFRLSFTAD